MTAYYTHIQYTCIYPYNVLTKTKTEIITFENYQYYKHIARTLQKKILYKNKYRNNCIIDLL